MNTGTVSVSAAATTVSAGSSVPAGWYPDPADARQSRLWDGTRWTEHVTVNTAAVSTAATYLPEEPPTISLHAAQAAAAPTQQVLASARSTQASARTLSNSAPAAPAATSPGYTLGTLADTAAVLDATRAAVDAPARPQPAAWGSSALANTTAAVAGAQQAPQVPGASAAAVTGVVRPTLPPLTALGAPTAYTVPEVITLAPPAPPLSVQLLDTASRKLSGLVALLCTLFLLYACWDRFGSDAWASYEQNKLRDQLVATSSVDTDEFGPEQGPATLPGDDNEPGLADLPAQSMAAAPVSATAPAAPAAPAATTDVASAVTATLGGKNAGKAGARAVGRIQIPAIGVDHVFVDGTRTEDLNLGPGVLRSGVFPGKPGNATLAGHRTTYGGPFRRINELKPGDKIIISVPGQADSIFEVRGSKIVSPKQVSVTHQTVGVRLTLSTCHPIGSAAQRLIVQAELVEGPHKASAVTSGWRFQI